jgi:hypothetical protein
MRSQGSKESAGTSLARSAYLVYCHTASPGVRSGAYGGGHFDREPSSPLLLKLSHGTAMDVQPVADQQEGQRVSRRSCLTNSRNGQ